MSSPKALRTAILDLPENAWVPALRQDGSQREGGAQVAELTDQLDLAAWPEQVPRFRVIVRRERPHPGAQLSFTDHDGHRFLATLTDLPGDPPPRWSAAAASPRERRGPRALLETEDRP